jgi:hypothetical protein
MLFRVILLKSVDISICFCHTVYTLVPFLQEAGTSLPHRLCTELPSENDTPALLIVLQGNMQANKHSSDYS